MKANVKKTLNQLTDSAIQQLEEYYREKRDEDLITAQFRWIKMGVRALANNSKITTEDMLAWVVAFKRLYQLNARFETSAQLDEYLAKEMDKIFGPGGFPEEYVQTFKEIG